MIDVQVMMIDYEYGANGNSYFFWVLASTR